MTDEQQERLKQIREKAKYGGATPNDVDFLVTLVDSQVAKPRDLSWALSELAEGWISNNERGEFYRNAQRVLELIVNDVENSMRDKCAEKVKELPTDYRDDRRPAMTADAFKRLAIKELESTSIQEQKS